MQSVRSAYIHVPFCQHRCGYCNFTLIADRPDLVPAYLAALETEFRQTLPEPQAVETIYLGGGTPSFLQPNELNKMLRLVTHWLPLTRAGEFTCEMNPGDSSLEKLGILASHGVNRISLGGQSFDDRKLKVLERDHSGDQLRDSINRCRAIISNISLDLIFAAPGESLDEWSRDVDTALSSPVSHLSTYGLTIEQGSAFYGRVLRRELEELDADLQLAMYEHIIERASAAGWEHYEVSSFSRAAQRSRHNENYWLGHPWFGFGPGAAAFLPSTCKLPQKDNPLHMVDTLQMHYPYARSVNHRSTTYYLRALKSGKSPIAERDPLSVEQYIRERLVFGLRRLEGVHLPELSAIWGSDVTSLFEPHLDRYIDQGWLEFRDQGQLRLTHAGLVISDSLWPDLL